MSIRMNPFKALYGYEAFDYVDLEFGDSRAPKAKDWIQDSQDILKVLKENLRTAQNQQKMYADKHRIEQSFEVRDLVYLRLQPYRQSSLKKKGAEKLKPRFYGPYIIIKKVGEVAYEIELPQESKIHNVFHVSNLKKTLGQHIAPSTELPPLDDEGLWILIPERIIQTRERKLKNRVIRQYLVQWKELLPEDAN